jgi:hypothetical protein
VHLVGLYYENKRTYVKPNFYSICRPNHEGIWQGVYHNEASPSDSACDAALKINKTKQKMEKRKMSILKCNLMHVGDNLPQFADLQREIRERESDYSNG